MNRHTRISLFLYISVFLVAACDNNAQDKQPSQFVFDEKFGTPTEEEQNLIDELRDDVRRVAKRKSTSGKPWIGHEQTLVTNVLNSDPRNFLNWQMIIYTMFYPYPDPIEIETLKRSKNWHK